MAATPPRQLLSILGDRYALMRRLALVLLDGLLIVLAFWGTFVLRLSAPWDPWISQSLPILLLLLPTALVILMQTGWYQGLTRYSGSHSLYGLLPRTALFLAITALLVPLFGLAWPPRSFWLIFWLLFSVLAITSRVLLRDLLRQLLAIQAVQADPQTSSLRRPAVVYGAGEAGSRLIDALRFDPRWKLAAVIDDDPSLWMWSRRLQGLPIAPPDQLPQLIRRHGLEAVLLAIPSAGRVRRRELVNELRELGLEVLTIPSLQEIASGHVRVADLRRVAIEDLLGRDPSTADPVLLRAAVSGKTVLISGGGGSIGSELARQVLALAPSRLILLDHSEYALYAIERELRQRLAGDPGLPQGVELITVLADVADQARMDRLCRRERVEVIFHAAAYKHVPLVEANLAAGLRNNVLGTQALLEAALATGVQRFTLISTDKAVRPTNAMGASKRVCELLVQEAAARQSRCVCAMVRFGNVLGSSGSVVPLFREQIAVGGPVTVTHPDVIRYFMTIGEAVQLVLQASAIARGGEVFLLDMGEPVAINDLARQMIELSGCSVRDADHPQGDIAIEYTGLRPGEKLYEELLVTPDDQPTCHPLIRQAREPAPASADLQQAVSQLLAAAAGDDTPTALRVLNQLVPDYRPSRASALASGSVARL
ncbi:MAG: nucleoside-diphosphate sugar epimerase/dehydratase [Cyanobacteriota bacterium]|nr:nucleoside-diphosphate sugar epimerase/dehydratase [Cyanobacteriota bacterium]